MSEAPSVLLHTDQPAAAREIVLAAHPGLRVATCDSYAGVPEALRECEAEVIYSLRFDGTPAFPREAMLSGPAVKWISVAGSGVDHLAPWDPGAVTVTNSAGVASDIMAEYALGAMLHFSLDLAAFRRAQVARRWGGGSGADAPPRVAPIKGRTALVVGLGQTGAAFAARAKAMGMTVLGVRARPKPTPNVDRVGGVADLAAMAGEADFILVCTPLTRETRGLIGAAVFRAMKRSAVLVDVSRGGVVAEAALLEALSANRLRGAALDVFETEPLPSDHPLWGFENVIVTPHCSSVYEGWESNAVRLFAENLWRYRRGEALENIVDPSRGY